MLARCVRPYGGKCLSKGHQLLQLQRQYASRRIVEPAVPDRPKRQPRAPVKSPARPLPPRDRTYTGEHWTEGAPPGTFRTAALIISGVLFFGVLGYEGASILRLLNKEDDHDGRSIDLAAVYDEHADEFDAEVESTEYWNGTMKLRRRLLKQARGRVLESAAGTGRNSEYYNEARVMSLTLVDKSKSMLQVAETKWPSNREGEDWAGKVHFVAGDLEESGTVTGQFDTIIQTMGLCSTDDPDKLMRSLKDLVKPGGKILLLEHGQGFFSLLNTVLDKSSRDHAERHGCWWNRDIGAIVVRSGLRVVETKRPWMNFGTLWYFVLEKPSQSGDERS